MRAFYVHTYSRECVYVGEHERIEREKGRMRESERERARARERERVRVSERERDDPKRDSGRLFALATHLFPTQKHKHNCARIHAHTSTFSTQTSRSCWFLTEPSNLSHLAETLQVSILVYSRCKQELGEQTFENFRLGNSEVKSSSVTPLRWKRFSKSAS